MGRLIENLLEVRELLSSGSGFCLLASHCNLGPLLIVVRRSGWKPVSPYLLVVSFWALYKKSVYFKNSRRLIKALSIVLRYQRTELFNN